jgi:hypothetical protein
MCHWHIVTRKDQQIVIFDECYKLRKFLLFSSQDKTKHESTAANLLFSENWQLDQILRQRSSGSPSCGGVIADIGEERVEEGVEGVGAACAPAAVGAGVQSHVIPAQLTEQQAAGGGHAWQQLRAAAAAIAPHHVAHQLGE